MEGKQHIYHASENGLSLPLIRLSRTAYLHISEYQNDYRLTMTIGEQDDIGGDSSKSINA